MLPPCFPLTTPILPPCRLPHATPMPPPCHPRVTSVSSTCLTMPHSCLTHATPQPGRGAAAGIRRLVGGRDGHGPGGGAGGSLSSIHIAHTRTGHNATRAAHAARSPTIVLPAYQTHMVLNAASRYAEPTCAPRCPLLRHAPVNTRPEPTARSGAHHRPRAGPSRRRPATVWRCAAPT